MKPMLLHICLTVLLTAPQAGPNPNEAPIASLKRLLDADRAFSTAGAGKTPLDAISAMFADDVNVPVGPSFVQGKANAIDAMKANPDYLAGHVEWMPVGGNISADGTQGFTFGYMDATKADGAKAAFKYLAYWVKGTEGWRVAVYRRRPSPGAPTPTSVGQTLPLRAVPVSADASRTRQYGESLAAAEKAFSDLAQTVGLGAAFAKNGRPDAVNMGGPKSATFVVGNEAIARTVGEGTPTDHSEVSWSADRVIVASSGDLGVTIGVIRLNKPVEGQPSAFAFFTIWRRDDPSKPWRYIAE